uniref:non-specific serine/threonine protein kinase n=1 Tax=Oryza glumipatula TaxID=40148 RepID=A0A0E0BEY6_9ORYZ
MPLGDCANKCLDNCACVVFQYKEHMECYLKSVLFNGKTFPGLPGTVYIKVPADFDVPEFHVHQWQRGGGGLAIQEDIAGCAAAATGDSNRKVLLNVSSSLSSHDAGKPVWPYLYGFLSALLVVEAIVIGFGCWLFSSKGLFRHSRVYAIDQEGYKLITSHFQRYTYADIKKATANFTGVIGRGGSGVVYKGVLDDERVVAVKVLKNVSRQSEEEFQAELSVIGRIYHMNLVRMWGCCSQAKHRILVSEYIENGSLAQRLFDHGFDDDVLDWNQRFRIALGVAKGLAYLHSECSEWIVHCDMKPENILLDKDLEPKITDFGLSKLLNRDGSDAILTRIRGTRGYMAPEWVTNLPVTEKVDVYSYGVILLELVKGIRISEWVIHGIKVCEMDIRMVVRATRQMMGSNEERSIEDLVDYRLNGDFNHVQVKLMLEIAVSCLEEDRSKRPNMNSVVQALISVEEWIVHCDRKPENILLDKDLEPKITDFELSKLLNRDGSYAILTRIRGTRGYMAPDYGVILLPLVKVIGISEWVIYGIKNCEMDTRMVVRAACEKLEPNERRSIEDLVDHRLNGDSSRWIPSPSPKHFREFVASEFRRPTGTDADARARLRLAGDYAYLLASVHHHKDLLFSYNIAVDRSEEMKKILNKSAASVGLQLPDMEQCEDRGGRYLRQVSQNFTFTVKPLTVTSFALRNLIRGVLPELHSIDGVVEPRNSSASGGALVFLGTIPGSLADVMNRKKRSCNFEGEIHMTVQW